LLRIGHRGAAAHSPENTLRSFKTAIELGVDMVELDVRLCRTGEVFVIHDDTVDRTTDGSGSVEDMGLEEMISLDAGSGERVPLLHDVIVLVGGRTGLNIELKARGTAGPVAELLSQFIAKGTHRKEDFIVSSFDPVEILRFRDLNLGIPMGFIFEDHSIMGVEFASELGAWSVHPRSDLIDEKIVGMARSKGLKVIAWTVNDEHELRRMTLLDIDGVITDRPEIFNS
jgi:glycerophosphoryl diester phosphodiesterase